MSDIKKIFDTLAGVEGGDQLRAVLEKELKDLRDEAGSFRIRAQEAEKAAKIQAEKDILSTMGVKDLDDLAGVKSAMDNLTQRGLKPEEVAQQITSLTKQVKQLTLQSEEDKKATQAERDKRINAMRNARTIEALTAARAIKPAELAKLVAGYVQIGDDEQPMFLENGTPVPLSDGIANYLKANPEFVSNAAAAGAGGGGGGPAGGNKDPDKMTMAEYTEWRKSGGGK